MFKIFCNSVSNVQPGGIHFFGALQRVHGKCYELNTVHETLKCHDLVIFAQVKQLMSELLKEMIFSSNGL